MSQFFNRRFGSHNKLSKTFFGKNMTFFPQRPKGKEKKGEEGSNYEKGGKRGNLFFMSVLVHIELTVNLSYDYEVGFKSRNLNFFSDSESRLCL